MSLNVNTDWYNGGDLVPIWNKSIAAIELLAEIVQILLDLCTCYLSHILE